MGLDSAFIWTSPILLTIGRVRWVGCATPRWVGAPQWEIAPGRSGSLAPRSGERGGERGFGFLVGARVRTGVSRRRAGVSREWDTAMPIRMRSRRLSLVGKLHTAPVMLRDLRHALRVLCKAPGFTAL